MCLCHRGVFSLSDYLNVTAFGDCVQISFCSAATAHFPGSTNQNKGNKCLRLQEVSEQHWFYCLCEYVGVKQYQSSHAVKHNPTVRFIQGFFFQMTQTFTCSSYSAPPCDVTSAQMTSFKFQLELMKTQITNPPQ